MLPAAPKLLKRLVFGIAAALSLASMAHAQQSSGNITGNATTGDTVIIDGAGTGFHRELSIRDDGKFNVRRVPTGEYSVTIKHADGTVSPAKAVVVRVGSTARVQ